MPFWRVLRASCGEKVANMGPTWVPRWSPNGEKLDAKIDQKLGASWDWFLRGFGRILGAKMEPCWHQNWIKIRSYDENAAKPKMFIKPMEFSWFLGFRGSKLGAKIDEKSIKKGGQHGKASWHRFLIDFGGFWEASWGRKSNNNRSKKASKKWWKKEGHQDGEKNVFWRFWVGVRPRRAADFRSLKR